MLSMVQCIIFFINMNDVISASINTANPKAVPSIVMQQVR